MPASDDAGVGAFSRSTGLSRRGRGAGRARSHGTAPPSAVRTPGGEWPNARAVVSVVAGRVRGECDVGSVRARLATPVAIEALPRSLLACWARVDEAGVLAAAAAAGAAIPTGSLGDGREITRRGCRSHGARALRRWHRGRARVPGEERAAAQRLPRRGPAHPAPLRWHLLPRRPALRGAVRYRHLTRLTVRYARWDLRAADLIDPISGQVACALYPLDKTANASGVRRVHAPCASAPSAYGPSAPAGSAIAPLLRSLMAEYAATELSSCARTLRRWLDDQSTSWLEWLLWPDLCPTVQICSDSRVYAERSSSVHLATTSQESVQSSCGGMRWRSIL